MNVLLTGASGLLGGYLLRELADHDHRVIAWGGPRQSAAGASSPVDLAHRDAVAAAFAAARPDVVLHAAALSSVAQCFQQPQQARTINIGGTQLLMELAAAANARLLLVSTDLVFDGQRGGYGENDPPSPRSVYGQTKSAAERAVLGQPRAAVVRASLLYGPTRNQRRGFFDEQLARIRAGQPAPFFVDEWRTPLALSTAARALAALALGDFEGLLHLGGPERMSRWEMGARLAKYLRCDESACQPVSRAESPSPEPRPRDSSLNSSAWRAVMPDQPWPSFEEALSEMLGKV
ncbi:MAG TPA: SDR family oxidoreductase [Pirellulales bacterium]